MAQPLCPYFGTCGGCSAQHIDYETQLENKKKKLASAIKYPEIEVFSKEPYHYRNRMDLIFHKKSLGFREKGKWHKIVDIDHCPISNAKLNLLLSEIREFFKDPDYFHLTKHTGTLRYAVIRTPGQDSCISFVLNPKSPKLAETIDQIKLFSAETSANNVLVTYVAPETDMSVSDDFFAIKGSQMLTENLLGKTFVYSAQGFFQNNSAVTELMQKYCHDLLDKNPDGKLLDLYGGVGTFGIMNSDNFNWVYVVENSEQCIKAARQNILNNNVNNISAHNLNAKSIQQLNLTENLFVIIDPPRKGMQPEAIKRLNKLQARQIIYISCNPAQLGKDLKKFTSYRINSAAMFDMFPQTPHIESIVELR